MVMLSGDRRTTSPLSARRYTSTSTNADAGRECSVVRQDRIAPLFRYGTVSHRPLKLVAGSSHGGRDNGMQPDVSIINWHKVCLFTNMVPNALDRLIDPLENTRNP